MCFAIRLFGQYSHVPVLPGMTGNTLINNLTISYKPSIILDYSAVRDTMFLKIDRVADSLECIYTGMKLPLPDGQDPTEYVYLDGQPNGINTEHTWPQGLGATGSAQSDMHHLYPSRVKTNSDRGNFPFGNIPDAQTEIWYYKNTERTSVPTNFRDAYSEGIRGTNGKFEPRESVKGDIARSLFYFYTMYKAQADAADPTFFQQMKSDICQWHYDDPVDRKEWERNQKIAHYQGGKENPFVLDCSLISRAYCNNIDQACEALTSIVQNEVEENALVIFPNPSHGTFFIRLHANNDIAYIVDIKNMLGQTIFLRGYDVKNGENIVEIDINDHLSGFYIITLKDINSNISNRTLYLKY